MRGREPDPARPDEFVGTRSFAAGGDVAVGDRFRLVTITQDQADRSGYEAFFKEEPEGPTLDAVLVGIADGPVQINDPTPLVVMPSSLVDRGAGVSATTCPYGCGPVPTSRTSGPSSTPWPGVTPSASGPSS